MAEKKRTLPGTKIEDLTGATFGRLTVIAYAGKKHHAYLWLCLCVCGTEKVISRKALRSGHTQSCGCLQSETARISSFKHGYWGTAIYRCWNAMRDRCYNPNNPLYKHYGGRGITMDQDWYSCVTYVVCDIGEPPFPGATLDRIDNDKGYEKDNVRWTTHRVQQNNKRTNVYLTYKGITQTQRQWEVALGFGRNMLGDRLKRGWTLEEALTTSPRAARKREQS
jgi:hypothetical protein